MENSYGWRSSRESTPIRLPGPDNMGWWVAVAFFVAVILHVGAFFALGHIKIVRGILPGEEMVTEPLAQEPVEVLPPEKEMMIPEEVETPPPPTAAALLDELDAVTKLPKDTEMELKPEIKEPEFAVRLENPAMAGDPQGIVVDPAAGIDLSTSMKELGKTANNLPLAAESQIVVDPGASVVDESNLNRFAEDLLKKGAGGKVEAGTLDGVVTLQDMVGLSPDVLVGKKTMLPSDLLFEYDSAELRQSAKVGLMKLALIIDRNPGLYCWIEGYSDLFGGESYNLSLSQRRAEAVEAYLVSSLRMNGERIVPRGYGIARPLVASGSVEDQAPNRRVEIRMRRNAPPAQGGQGAAVKPTPPPAPVVVKPMRALPVEEETPAPTPQRTRPQPQTPPKAHVVDETPPPKPVAPPRPPKAQPVEEESADPPKAEEVVEDPQRAEPVEEE